MFRKLALGVIAAASIGAAALLPTAASASPLIVPGWGWGWGPSYGYVASPGYIVGTPMMLGNPCLQQRFVPTKYGMRLRTVNVCF